MRTSLLKNLCIFIVFVTVGRAVLAGDPAAEGSIAPQKDFSFEVSAGYDTKYIFRGINYADDLSWTQAALDIAINDVFNLWVGGWWATDATGDYTEFDFMVELGMTFEKFYIGLGTNNYVYPATGDPKEFELALNTEYYLGSTPLTLINQVFYQPKLDSIFWNGGIKWDSNLTECLAIQAAATVGYNKRYYIENSDWNNVDLRLTLPFSPNEKLTISPYAAVSFPLAALEDQDLPTETYGGISAAFTF